MSLRYMLMGLLLLEPRSGYTLHKRFFTSNRPALSQIYRTLSDMVKEGVIVYHRVKQDKLPDQKIYSVTKAGVAELDEWLKKPQSISMGLDPFLTQIWFSPMKSEADVIINLNNYIKSVKAELHWCKNDARNIIAKGVAKYNNPKNDFYWNSAMDQYQGTLEWSLRWAKRMVKQVTAMQEADAKSGDKAARKKTSNKSKKRLNTRKTKARR